MNEHNPQGKEIRFIDSSYHDLFHIPDGATIQISYPNETFVDKCEFIDEYHTKIGYSVFHICQFAEIMESNGAVYQPEPEILEDEVAWKVGRDRYLAIQTCEDGYDYTLLDENFIEVDGGQIDAPEWSMLEVRKDILDSFGLSNRELKSVDYDDLMEEMFQTNRQAAVMDKPIKDISEKQSVLAQLSNKADVPNCPKTIKQKEYER